MLKDMVGSNPTVAAIFALYYASVVEWSYGALQKPVDNSSNLFAGSILKINRGKYTMSLV